MSQPIGNTEEISYQNTLQMNIL